MNVPTYQSKQIGLVKEPVNVYRGDKAARDGQGIFSRMYGCDLEKSYLSFDRFIRCTKDLPESLEPMLKAIYDKQYSSALAILNQVLEGKDQKILNWLIEQHTDKCIWSPFVSTTLNPRLAQTFANRSNETIYEISLQPDRYIIDENNIGCSGNSKEILVIGSISPEEMKRIKIDNSLQFSELALPEKPHFIARTTEPTDNNTKVRDQTNWKKALGFRTD